MKRLDDARVLLALRELAHITGDLARYCDHIEHNEAADKLTLTRSGERLRRLATGLATAMQVDLKVAYAQRLVGIERAHPAFDAQDQVGLGVHQVRSWRELQILQQRHDRIYHPDVIGLSRLDQLRHYTLHVAKLTSEAASLFEGDSGWTRFAALRLPDILVFGIKMATVAGLSLADESLPAEWGGLHRDERLERPVLTAQR